MSVHEDASAKERLLQELAGAIVDMDEEKTVELAGEAVRSGIDAYEVIERGLSAGMERAGQLFEEEEYFIPELLMCSDAMYAGLEVLRPYLQTGESEDRHKVVIGVIEGDTHDIGKNLVKMMLETSGFQVTDLGRDIPPQAFVDKAREVKADIIAISTLMTTTMEGMGKVIQLLNQQSLREHFKVMIGGGPISQSFANKIGADGYASNASEAVRLARRLVGAGAVRS